MAISVQILYTQDNTQADNLWQSVTVPESDKQRLLTGLAGGTWYVKMRETDGTNYGPFTSVFTRTVTGGAGDTTSPWISDIDVVNITQTTADFNVRIDEGVLYWAVYPTADAMHTKSEIVAGTGAIDFGSVSTLHTLVVSQMAGFVASTAYKVHYFAEDAAGNVSGVFVTIEFTTLAASTFQPVSFKFVQEAVASTNNLTANSSLPFAWAAQGLPSKYFEAAKNGSVIMDVTSGNSNLLGFNLTGSFDEVTSIEYRLFYHTGNYFYSDAANSNIDTGVLPVVGDIVMLDKVADVVYYKKSSDGGSTWVTLASVNVGSNVLYPVVAIRDANMTASDVQIKGGTSW